MAQNIYKYASCIYTAMVVKWHVLHEHHLLSSTTFDWLVLFTIAVSLFVLRAQACLDLCVMLYWIGIQLCAFVDYSLAYLVNLALLQFQPLLIRLIFVMISVTVRTLILLKFMLCPVKIACWDGKTDVLPFSITSPYFPW